MTILRVACLPGAPYDAVATHGFDMGDGTHPKRTIVRLTAFSIRYDTTVLATEGLLVALASPTTAWDDLVGIVHGLVQEDRRG